MWVALENIKHIEKKIDQLKLRKTIFVNIWSIRIRLGMVRVAGRLAIQMLTSVRQAMSKTFKISGFSYILYIYTLPYVYSVTMYKI